MEVIHCLDDFLFFEGPKKAGRGHWRPVPGWTFQLLPTKLKAPRKLLHSSTLTWTLSASPQRKANKAAEGDQSLGWQKVVHQERAPVFDWSVAAC